MEIQGSCLTAMLYYLVKILYIISCYANVTCVHFFLAVTVCFLMSPQTSKNLQDEKARVQGLEEELSKLQSSLDAKEAELEKQKKAAQDELTHRKRVESQLERMTQTFTVTITTLKTLQEEVTGSSKENVL